MSLRVSLSIFAILFLMMIPNSHAKRYIIPSWSDVNVEIGEHYRESSLNPESIKIFNWNMYKGDKSSWKRDYEVITRGYDILLLQEIYLDFQMGQTFYEDNDYYYRVATSFVDTKNRDAHTGVGIASNTQMLRYISLRSHYREPIIKTPKMVMIGEFPIAGTNKTLMTATIHAINFVPAYKLRAQLRQVANVLKNHDGPVVWGGDFNTWSKKKMRYMKEVMASIGLKDVKFPDGNERMKTLGHYLDHIWYKGLDVVNSQVYGHIDGSDHKAMAVEFKLAE